MIEAQRDFVNGEEVTHDRWIVKLEFAGEYDKAFIADIMVGMTHVVRERVNDDAIIRTAAGIPKHAVYQFDSYPRKSVFRFFVYNISGCERAAVIEEVLKRSCLFYNFPTYRLQSRPKPAPIIITPDTVKLSGARNGALAHG